MKDISKSAYNIADLREIAQRRLPKGLFEFVDRGTEDEIALRNNRAASLAAIHQLAHSGLIPAARMTLVQRA